MRKLTITNSQTDRLDQSHETENTKNSLCCTAEIRTLSVFYLHKLPLLQRAGASAFSLLVIGTVSGRQFLFTVCTPEKKSAGLTVKQCISLRRSFSAHRSGRHGDGSCSLRGAVRGSSVTRTHAGKGSSGFYNGTARAQCYLKEAQHGVNL